MDERLSTSLDGLYAFMADAYKGNWVFRFADTPFMEEAKQKGNVESVHGHAWAAMAFWYHFRHLYPALNAAVDATKVYELLLNHDLGEIYYKDTPLYGVMKGKEKDVESERRALERLAAPLIPKTRVGMLTAFDIIEKDADATKHAEAPLARFIDHLQGNHFAMTFGTNLSQYAEPIKKMVVMRFARSASRLVEALEGRGEAKAAAEVKEISEYHLGVIGKQIG